MSVKLLSEQRLESLSLKGGCTGSSESTLVKISHCWKAHVTAHLYVSLRTLSELDLTGEFDETNMFCFLVWSFTRLHSKYPKAKISCEQSCIVII